MMVKVVVVESLDGPRYAVGPSCVVVVDQGSREANEALAIEALGGGANVSLFFLDD